MSNIALGINEGNSNVTCSNSTLNMKVQTCSFQHIPEPEEEINKNTNTILWYMLEREQKIALRREVTESGMFNYLSSHIGEYEYFDSTPIEWGNREWIAKPDNYIKINRYRNRKLFKPEDRETQNQFILTWCVLRWRMKPTISYQEMVCHALTDAIRYFKDMDEKAITAEIANTAYRVMNNPHKFDYLKADKDQDEREYITNPNLTNRRQISNKARGELKRANRILISSNSDQQNATRLKSSRATIQRQRKANNGLSTYEQREQLISTWYDVKLTDKENLTLINSKGNGINVSLRTLQYWKKLNGYSRKTLTNSPEAHQRLLIPQPIQFADQKDKSREIENMKVTEQNNISSYSSNEVRTLLMATPDPQNVFKAHQTTFDNEDHKTYDDIMISEEKEYNEAWNEEYWCRPTTDFEFIADESDTMYYLNQHKARIGYVATEIVKSLMKAAEEKDSNEIDRLFEILNDYIKENDDLTRPLSEIAETFINECEPIVNDYEYKLEMYQAVDACFY